MKTNTLLALWNSYITAAITASATSLVLSSVTDIPTAPFMALLDCGSDDEEVVKVTAVATATKTLTIVRAQGGTTAVAHGKETLFHHCEIGAVNINLDGLTVTLAGSSALNAMSLTVTDNLTCSSGRSSGLTIEYTAAGTKTGTGYVDGLSVIMTITGDNPLSSCLYLHTNTISGNPTLGMVLGLYIDMNDSGTDCERYFALNIDMGQTSVIAGESGVMRFRRSGNQILNSIFQLEPANSATYLFDFWNRSLPYHSANVSVEDGRIGIMLGDTAAYLKVYSS